MAGAIYLVLVIVNLLCAWMNSSSALRGSILNLIAFSFSCFAAGWCLFPLIDKLVK